MGLGNFFLCLAATIWIEMKYNDGVTFINDRLFFYQSASQSVISQSESVTDFFLPCSRIARLETTSTMATRTRRELQDIEAPGLKRRGAGGGVRAP